MNEEYKDMEPLPEAPEPPKPPEWDERKLQMRTRTIKQKVEDQSKIVEEIVERLIGTYLRDIDALVREIRDKVKNRHELTDAEVEETVMKIPIFMYFASDGLEQLGIQGDTAKARRVEAYSSAIMESLGRTVQQRQSEAELASFAEYLVEAAYTRAYRKLKTKLEMAEHVFSGAKKVLSMRIAQVEAVLRDPSWKPQGGRG